MHAHVFRTLVASFVFVSSAAAQLSLEPTLASEPQLFAATTDGGVTGAVVGLIDGRAPVLDALGPTDGGTLLRRFGQQLFVVNRSAGTIQRVPMNGGPAQLYSLGTGSQPMDIAVVGTPSAGGVAWVSRRDDPMLLRLDLASGVGTDALDLSPVGGGETISLGTMAFDRTRLFVQVRVADPLDVPGGDSGVLAVVDLASGQLVDVDPGAQGIQGVALQGAPPRFRMQILGGTLFVSTTDSFHDIRGGIERVDLRSLTSVGYAISEAGGHSDMGGFVMIDATRGYYVFHTDLLASAHLVSFTVAGGPEPGSLIDLLGDTVDVLVHDPSRRRLYLPSGFASNGPGLYAFSTETNALVGAPLNTGLRPHDVLLVASPALFQPAP